MFVKVVGICGSGKSSLVGRLRARGYDARQVSQEHSGVPDLWLRRRRPDALIFLDASNEEARRRYTHLQLNDRYLQRERQRLAHAREHADCYVLTDGLTPDEVLLRVLRCLQQIKARHTGDS